MSQQDFFNLRLQEEARAKHHLTSAQRQAMLKELLEWAPDAVLVYAVRQSRFHYMWLKDLDLPAPDAAPATREETGLGQPVEKELGPFPVVRGNIDPGKPSIGKIGSGTREWILGELKAADRKTAHFGTKFFEHLKLLWSRGEIKFDGERYYL